MELFFREEAGQPEGEGKIGGDGGQNHELFVSLRPAPKDTQSKGAIRPRFRADPLTFDRQVSEHGHPVSPMS